jgi:hypothetical protein
MNSTIDGWQRGYVDATSEHFQLLIVAPDVGGHTQDKVVALIGPPNAGLVSVSFLIEESEANASTIEKLEKEIKYYLLELKEPDPWKYAQYHCETASNLYSSVQWSFIKAGSKTLQVISELDLDRFFWNNISTNLEFQSWFLQQTKFAARTFDLVLDEKWHQRWYRDPITGEESETDILLIFKDRDNSDRCAIHIENKPLHGKWRPHQPESYPKRAENRAAKLGYAKFQTALIAPLSFIERWPREANLFDIRISYEDIAKFVPQFGQSAQ